MGDIKLIAVHHIIRTGDEVAPGKPFLEAADEAEILIANGAAVLAPVAEEAATAKAAAPAKTGKKAAAAPAEPNLDDEV